MSSLNPHGGLWQRQTRNASVVVVACCNREEEGGETSITFSISDDSDGLLTEMKVKNAN